MSNRENDPIVPYRDLEAEKANNTLEYLNEWLIHWYGGRDSSDTVVQLSRNVSLMDYAGSLIECIIKLNQPGSQSKLNVALKTGNESVTAVLPVKDSGKIVRYDLPSEAVVELTDYRGMDTPDWLEQAYGGEHSRQLFLGEGVLVSIMAIGKTLSEGGKLYLTDRKEFTRFSKGGPFAWAIGIE